MGKCSSCLRCGVINRYGGSNRRIVLLLAGLDNSGKTTAAKGLVGDPTDDVVPTVGFASIQLIHRGYKVIIYDVGGGPQIRGIWIKYFGDVHGVIFVVDASDKSRMGECKVELENMLCNEKLAGKPVLLLANKQDVVGAMDEIDIVESLCLEQLVNKQKCPTKVEICSTLLPDMKGQRNIDPGLLSGYRWLLAQIINNYSKLNARVEKDVKEEQERVAVERENWKRRRDREASQIIDDNRQEINANGPTFFRPIREVIKDVENNADAEKIELRRGSGSDKKVDSNQNERRELPHEPNERGDSSKSDSNGITTDIREQLENKGKHQTKKLSVVTLRNNKVRPQPSGTELPPVIVNKPRGLSGGPFSSPPLDGSTPYRWRQLPPLKRPLPLGIRPVTSRSLGNEGEAWGLQEDLEVVLPANDASALPKSDNDDVIVG